MKLKTNVLTNISTFFNELKSKLVKSKIEKLLWFEKEDGIHFLFVQIADITQPLNRRFFSKERCAGTVLLAKHHIVLTEEIEYNKIDKWLEDCVFLDIQGVDEGSMAFLDSKKQKLVFLATAQQAHDLMGEPTQVQQSDPLLSKLEVEFIGLVEGGTIQSAEEFAKAFKNNSQVVEYVLILKNLSSFKRIEKNHFHVVQTAKTKVSMLASVLKVVDNNPVSPLEW